MKTVAMDGQLDSVIPKSAVTVRYLKEEERAGHGGLDL
jgi:hypothetical protein